MAARTAEAFLIADGSISADELSCRVGGTNRYQLRRRLTGEGFRGTADLMGLLRIVRWLWIAETAGASLSAQELRVGRDAAVAYRLIKSRTGLGWTECRKRGAAWFIENYLSPGTDERARELRAPADQFGERRCSES